jgi:hypothetical protein
LNFGPNDLNNFIGFPQGQIISGQVAELNPDGTSGTQSKVWVPLIWRALNYSGYDVPPEWIKVDLGQDTGSKYRQFNEYVKELSGMEGWAKYAVEVLTNAGLETFAPDDNDFDSPKVEDLSNRYADSYKGRDFNKFEMAQRGGKNTYIYKANKYKQKYLQLKNQLN